MSSEHSLRTLLREHTREAHQRLDEVVGAMDPFATTAGYHAYLLGMYRLYERYGAEQDWAAKESGLPACSEQLMSCIAADLGAPPQATVADVNESEMGAHPDDTSRSWAAAYVLEGASMGARHIVKQVATTELPHAFLSRLATDSHERWPKFIEALNRVPCDGLQAIESAKTVFAYAYNCFALAKTSTGEGSSIES